MDPDLYQSVYNLFREVKQLDAEARAAALQGRDPKVVKEVHRLLEQHDRPTLRSPLENQSDPDADTVVDDLVGRKIGDYMILSLIGAGGMGRVFKAEHTLMRRKVALKELTWVSQANLDSPRVRRFFEREIQAASRLSHPNIVTAYDAGQTDGHFWYAMELVDGVDLSKLLRTRGPMPFPQATECVLQAARGLAFAHESGIIHRDIKPANLLLNHDGLIKILDLGLAKLSDVEEEADADDDDNEKKQKSLTNTGHLVGSVHYMAPEHAANAKNADARSDIYSLGVTFYRLLTGELPFKGDTSVEVLIAHREKQFPRLADSLTGAPEGLDDILNKMTARDPEDRYQTMREVIEDLESLAMRHGWTMSVPESPNHASRRQRESKEQKRTLGLGTVAAIVLVTAGILAVIEAQRWPSVPEPAQTHRPAVGTLEAKAEDPQEKTTAPRNDSAWRWFTDGLSYRPTPGVRVEPPKVLRAHSRRLSGLAFSPDGRWLVTTSSDRTLRIWDAKTFKQHKALTDNVPRIQAMAFSSDAEYFVVGTDTGQVVLLDASDWSVHARLEGHEGPVHAVRFVEGKRLLVSGGEDGSLRIWDLKKQTQRRLEQSEHPILTLDVNASSGEVIAGDDEGRLIHLHLDRAGLESVRAHRDAVRAAAYRPGSSRFFSGGSDGRLHAWAGFNLPEESPAGKRSIGSIWALAYSPDGRWMASGHYNAKVFLWDLQANRRRLVLAGHEGPVTTLAFSPDGRQLAVDHGDGVCLWTVSLEPRGKPSAASVDSE